MLRMVGWRLWQAVAFSAAMFAVHATPSSDLLRVMGPQGINLWKLQQSSQAHDRTAGLIIQDTGKLNPGHSVEFPAYYFEQPLDHFSNSSETFAQRYWVSTRHYAPEAPGPVIVLDGGETSGEDRLSFLDTGIVDILTSATGGVGVILEHRYYGDSIPVANFSTDSLRWLNNAQAAADSANFMANVKFPDINEDLTAPGTPWIYYGGSYAGARAAHMRILYPDLVYGAIASSGVTHATIENWEYMDIIRKAADTKCSSHLENSISSIDSILAIPRMSIILKGLFGLASLQHNEDFVSVLESPLDSWQAKNWDPEVGSTKFDEFCKALGKPPFGISAASVNAPYGDPARMIKLPGGLSLDFTVLNYAKYIKDNYVSQCPESMTVEDCFGTFDDAKFQDTSLSQTWRAWLFQVCTEWGYFTTAPPDQKTPRIISRMLTLAYESRICHQAFPPGKHFSVPSLPNVTAVNALGDFSISADRLAIIDGEVDPWRPATPHSEYAEDREDTLTRPFKLIPNGVHHYDEYGLRNTGDEPEEIRKIHGEMIVFVMEWIKQWEFNKN